MLNKNETIETLQFVKNKMEGVTRMDTFQWMKPKYKERVHLMVNLCYDIIPLVYNDNKDVQKAVLDGFNLVNEFYCSLYTKNDVLRKTIYGPIVIREVGWKINLLSASRTR